ncbi:choice-of-anchor I domain-containing protein [Rubritalea tangerina]|uniref:Choice-of-anchor I domain-containing protein n=1 Tax=Rubritalea tangerina TaxID=430798 RepID=A0ABW4ZDT1_9BACT
MKHALLTALALSSPLIAAPQINPIQRIMLPPGAGEIVSVSENHRQPILAVTQANVGGVHLFKRTGNAFKASHSVNFVEYFQQHPIKGFSFDEVSSVSLDPLGRGFGVAALINKNKNDQGNEGTGLLGLFDYTSGKILGTLPAGFHPDQVGFSKDGKWIALANEGEMGSGGIADNPGSLSLYDLTSVTNSQELIEQIQPHNFEFSPNHTSEDFLKNVHSVRSHDLADGTYLQYLEPEFTCFSPDSKSVFVALQENNAIATFDLTSMKWKNITDLGVHKISIDPSDKDKKADTSTIVYGAPMPDTIASFQQNGKTYIATANEGDARGDDKDTVKLAKGAFNNGKNIPKAPNHSPYELDPKKGGIGRLGLVANLCDTNNDGIAEKIVAYGTRDLAIWEVSPNGALKRVSAFALEDYVLNADPKRHNSNDGGQLEEFDKRSDNKGPEPEALAVHTTQQGTTYTLVANERQNGLVLIDITKPTSPEALAYLNDSDHALFRPESVQLIDLNGSLTAIVGYEAYDDKAGGIGIYTLNGIPTTAKK